MSCHERSDGPTRFRAELERPEIGFDAVTEYLTLPEVAHRWGVPADSPNLRRAAMKGALRLAFWVRGTCGLLHPERGELVPVRELDGRPAPVDVNGWCYPLGGDQIDAFEVEYSAAVKLPEADGVRYLLPKPVLLSELLRDGVAMAADLRAAEIVLGRHARDSKQARAAETKERQSQLMIISAMLADAYRYDPRGRSGSEAVAAITAAISHAGGSLSSQTVRKHLDAAISELPLPASHERRRAAALMNS